MGRFQRERTNYLGAGVGNDKVTNNFVANTGKGGWTAVNGENGSGVDYRFVQGRKLARRRDRSIRSWHSGEFSQRRKRILRSVWLYDIWNYPVQGANNGGPAQQNGISDSDRAAWLGIE